MPLHRKEAIEISIFDSKLQREIKEARRQHEEEEKRKKAQAAVSAQRNKAATERRIQIEIQQILARLPEDLKSAARGGRRNIRIFQRESTSPQDIVYKYKQLKSACKRAGFNVWDEKACQALWCDCFNLMVRVY